MRRAKDLLDQAGLAVLVGLLIGGLGWLLSLLYGGRVPLGVCLAAGLVAGATWRVLSRYPVEDVGELVPAPPPTRSGHAGFADLQTVESLLGSGFGDQDRFDHRVRPLLAGLATDLLRQRHGLHWPAHRERVRDVVGPTLWALLDGQPMAAGRAVVTACVDELEAVAASSAGRPVATTGTP